MRPLHEPPAPRARHLLSLLPLLLRVSRQPPCRLRAIVQLRVLQVLLTPRSLNSLRAQPLKPLLQRQHHLHPRQPRRALPLQGQSRRERNGSNTSAPGTIASFGFSLLQVKAFGLIRTNYQSNIKKSRRPQVLNEIDCLLTLENILEIDGKLRAKVFDENVRKSGHCHAVVPSQAD